MSRLLSAVPRTCCLLILLMSLSAMSGCTIWYPKSSTPTDPESGQTVNWVEHVRQLSLMQEWQIRGKIGVRTEDDGGSAYLDWSQSFDSFYILLSGPFGQGSTIISGNPTGARLENTEGTWLSESPEKLVQEHTGWQIPIQHLLYWVKGIPAPRGEAQTTFNPLGTLSTLEQDGWSLQFDRYGNAMGALLPQRIKIHKDNLKVTLIIKEWIPLESNNHS